MTLIEICVAVTFIYISYQFVTKEIILAHFLAYNYQTIGISESFISSTDKIPTQIDKI
jgi:hypothetical protein